MNAWLGSYFTVQNGFMVKPQPKIRPPYTPGNDGARVSLDSYNGEVVPRELGGRELSLRSPDFMVVRATDDIANDVMVLIVEVKLGYIPLRMAIEQLMDYLLGMRKKINLDPTNPLFDRSIWGLLVVGNDVHILSLTVNGGQGFAGPFYFTDGPLHGILQGLAQ
jgi:hypothetical protein